MTARSRLLMATSGLIMLGLGLPAQASHATHTTASEACDAKAGDPRDLDRNPAFSPVNLGSIKIGEALSACREAYRERSGARQTYQLARALYRSGAPARALAMLREAASGGHRLSAQLLATAKDDIAQIDSVFEEPLRTAAVAAPLLSGDKDQDSTR
ncbi:hypothetical protein BJF93_06975 [Xaviernesmea oryzae]|uniref:Sel1 repeat family protein n=1 Tax=Xaviernesmea oryzae TaxID=464029 RepID=A0A1Q9ASH9_9HYPH|nr:hypothetical protein [Xaviernesmea oryzae]OLP58338.1 hypothetical protein BJF93_06975 [Xaviernesmea oryzae]SEL41374.1 hypothetical protein SAMN04487976_10819 [Xaviernesmea oryzae]